MIFKCPVCRRKRWWIQKRIIKIPQVATPITSQNRMCKSCFKNIKILSGL